MAYKKLKAKIMGSQLVASYKIMWPFIKPIWFRALLSVLICIPIGSLDAVIALALKPYTDIVMIDKNMSSPWYIPLLIVAFTSTQGVLNYIGNYLNVWVGGKITMSLKDKLYQKLLMFSPAFYDACSSGGIIFRFNNDADNACAGLLGNLKVFVTRLFSSISLICVLFYNSWELALIAVLVLTIAIVPLSKIKGMINSIVDSNNISLTALNTTYNETFAGNRTITSYNLQNPLANKFREILSAVFHFSIKMTQKTGWISPFMHFIISIGIGLAIALGSWLIVNGHISSGSFVSFILALILLYNPIKNLGGNAIAVQQSFLAIDRVFELLNMDPHVKERENAIELKEIEKFIEFKNVSFEYTPDIPVLKDINIKIKAGETVALVGNSGGGKTTFVNLIPRFYDNQSGEILIDGINVKDFTLTSLRENIAVVFQDNFLFAGTIRENVLLGSAQACEYEVNEALKMAYLSEFVNSLENGVNTEIGERGVLLSGGQKQRVAIARAFLKNAPIIILDEATSALDNKSEEIVQKAIDNLMQHKTVFVIAHRLSTIQNADRIAVINEGKLIELGTHDELIKIKGGQYKHLYEMQFRKQEITA